LSVQQIATEGGILDGTIQQHGALCDTVMLGAGE
jgi:hypothetical protein